MRLYFKQRLFSWFDSYDIYDEAGQTVYTVQGKPAWGHRLEIFDSAGIFLGRIKEEVFTFLPRFRLYSGETLVGEIRKNFTLFKPSFTLDCCGWQVSGAFWGWEYQVLDSAGGLVMTASKELFRMTDTYVLDIVNPADALFCLMVVLAIDAEKCSGAG